MILESVEHGLLIWPTVEENGVIRTKKYAELSAAEKIQADCDMKTTNIILQGLPADIYSLVNHHRVSKDLWERVQLLMQEKTALKEQVDSLEQNLSKQIKEKECLLQTFTVFKNKSKEKENKYMENEIDLEKKIKKLDNIIFKVGQSAQTVHMLTKPQVFYDNIHKQALGYQNLFYLKKAQRIKPTLYDGIVMSAKHVAMPVIDDEETLILEEESRSKMSEKEKDLKAIKQNISHKSIDYEKLNQLSEDFLCMSNPTSKPSDASPIKIEALKELPKVSLVNESLKKLK
ncbi:hypothetical protein Tco_0932200, partial [Tanacetum coccineum]